MPLDDDGVDPLPMQQVAQEQSRRTSANDGDLRPQPNASHLFRQGAPGSSPSGDLGSLACKRSMLHAIARAGGRLWSAAP